MCAAQWAVVLRFWRKKWRATQFTVLQRQLSELFDRRSFSRVSIIKRLYMANARTISAAQQGWHGAIQWAAQTMRCISQAMKSRS